MRAPIMFLAICYLLYKEGKLLNPTIARIIIAPLELPVGVVTGILGGILFVYALTKRQVKLWKKAQSLFFVYLLQNQIKLCKMVLSKGAILFLGKIFGWAL